MNAFITPILIRNNRANHSQTLTPRHNRNSKPIIKPCVRTRVHPHTMCTTSTTTLESFLKEAGDLGTLRFITISNGAVLETIGRLDYNMSTFAIPNKGDYITIASLDKTFECHINTSKVKTVTMTSEKAKMGDHQLHVIRLLGQQDDIILSILLQWDPSQGPGNYLHGAEAAFEKLQQTFGSTISL